MKIAALQPGYLPWLGFFEQMAKVDLFVFLDDVQYTKADWRSRNRIRTQDGWIWLTVPVFIKRRSKQSLLEAEIDNHRKWWNKHWGLIQQNYHQAPYFHEYKEFFQNVYVQTWEYLLDLDLFIIDYLKEALKIKTKTIRSSKLKIPPLSYKKGNKRKTEKLIKICQAVEATKLYDGKSAQQFIDEKMMKNNKIEIEYQNYQHPIYNQQFEPFIPYLSTIDLLFNHGPESLEILLGKKKVKS